MKLLSSIVSLSILLGGVVAPPSFAGLSDTYETQQSMSYETATFGHKSECEKPGVTYRYVVDPKTNAVYSIMFSGYIKKVGYIGRTESSTMWLMNSLVTVNTEYKINQSGTLVQYSQYGNGEVTKFEYIRLAPIRAGYGCS